MSTKTTVTVIVPVYNGEGFIDESLQRLGEFLHVNLPEADLLVVDDGSTDNTAEIVERARTRIRSLRLLKLQQNEGKYGALRAGFLHCTSTVRMFIDADLPFDLRVVTYATDLVEAGFHLVVGDRTLPESEQLVRVSPLRKLASRLFATLVRQALTGGMFDTQCGFKALRGDVAEALFRVTRVSSFAGDAELVYLALKYNLAIRRIPVRFERNAPSSLRISIDTLEMIRQIFLTPIRWYAGGYKSNQLAAIGTQRYWQ